MITISFIIDCGKLLELHLLTTPAALYIAIIIIVIVHVCIII